MSPLDHYSEVWLVDFEFRAPDGERPDPICMVAREFASHRLVRVWQDELRTMCRPPFPISADVLYVAYYASAELGCHLALRWPAPIRVLDLFAEFRCLTSGLPTVCGSSLLGALAHFGLGAVDAAVKDSMRELALRGGPYTADERRALMDYCQSDVDALGRLLPAMIDRIDLPRALLRGRYMAAAARIEWTGAPIDVPSWHALRDNWADIQGRLIGAVDSDYGVFEEQTFKVARFRDYLVRHDIPWPHLPSGSLALDRDTFKRMAVTYPQLHRLYELRRTLAELRLSKLSVGSDGRNRCLLSAFRSKTGRNQPSTTRFVFGLPTWTRSLIKPDPGRALAYVDYEQQEFGIAAALSGDGRMMEAYRSGDPYLAFAIQAGAAPEGATKRTHPTIRAHFKVCALAVQYGMAAASLAMSLDQPEARGRDLLRLHRQTYSTFWRWSEAAVNHAMLNGWLQTVFGWRVHVGPEVNPRSMANFPMQANGADMLRLACCLMTERGIDVCAPVHDAVLVEGPADRIGEVVSDTQEAMREASEVVLSGFSLRTDATVIEHPDRFSDDRGADMWRTVTDILADLQPGAGADPNPAPTTGYPGAGADPLSLMSYPLSLHV